jgi:hypothetical protein
MNAMRGLVAALALLALAATAGEPKGTELQAEAPAAVAIPFKKEARGEDGDAQRIGAAWLVAAAALVGAFWFVRRRMLPAAPRTGSGPALLLQSIRLAPQATLHVVEFGECRILIAQTPQGVSAVASSPSAHGVSAEKA